LLAHLDDFEDFGKHTLLFVDEAHRNLSSRMRRSSLVFSEQPPLCRVC
jgi:hypothetical protein